MKVKELYKELKEIIKHGGEDSEVYFDTEAASFDVNYVKIQSINFDHSLFTQPIVTLGCPYEDYMHIKLVELEPGVYKKEVKRSYKENKILELWNRLKDKI
jgi:hypothetical protein